MRSDALSISADSPRGRFSGSSAVSELGLLLSILLMPKAHLSSIGDAPWDEDGEGSGCEPVMKTDSERGVWFPPRPREGGTPTSFVGGGVAFAVEAASSA